MCIPRQFLNGCRQLEMLAWHLAFLSQSIRISNSFDWLSYAQFFKVPDHTDIWHALAQEHGRIKNVLSIHESKASEAWFHGLSSMEGRPMCYHRLDVCVERPQRAN